MIAASAKIHPLSVIEDGAVVGENVVVGPFCHVGPKVVLHEGVELLTHVVVTGRTVIGRGTRIFANAVIGGDPQRWHRRLDGLDHEYRVRINAETKEDPDSARVARLERDRQSRKVRRGEAESVDRHRADHRVALQAASTAPRSRAARSAASSPCTRHSASAFAVLPPLT